MKKEYVKPEAEIVKMDIRQGMLVTSDLPIEEGLEDVELD